MEIFKNNFDELSDDDKNLLDSYFTGYPYKGAGYTLVANLSLIHISEPTRPY